MSDVDLSRSRFANVVHSEAVPAERWDPSETHGLASRELAVALGAQQLGYCQVSLDPGKRSCPYHFHHAEEELFVVLSGEAILRQGDAEGEERVPVAAGDVISFPAGTGVAHQFLNESEAPFIYLAVSNRHAHDVAEYPDSDKVLIRRTGLMLRRSPTLGYLDGER